MNEQQFGDFISALGEEFCQALNPVVGWENISPHDGYEVFIRVFKQNPSPQFLTSLSELQLEQLRTGCEEYFECRGVSAEHIREAIARTLARWPDAENEEDAMPFDAAETAAVVRLVAWALEEDLGDNGDLTSLATIPPDLDGRGVLVARAEGVVAGLPAAEHSFHAVDATLVFAPLIADGSPVQRGTQLATVSGRMRSILTGERTALNFLQRLSGVATQTWRYTSLVADLPVQVLDTRKTTPGWRVLEKYAVRGGGGHNHRMGLGDGILIKDNHLAALGTGPQAITEAVQRARQLYGTRFPLEIEVDNLAQFDVALTVNPDIVLLDNMSLEEMREAVRRRNVVAPSVQLEASGGVTLTTLRGIAETGVDRISVGALTHSAVALDIALDYLS